MADDLSRIRRYELKYTIDETLAAEIRDYIHPFFRLDPYVPPGKREYIVNTIYFDTPDLRFYYDTRFKRATRLKPRARFYGLQPGPMIWPEIKYRHGSVIWKTRYGISVEQWPSLFHPPLSTRKTPEYKPRIDRFDEVIHWYGAESKLHVRYVREPYVTEVDTYGRVTFDRHLSYRPLEGQLELTYDEREMIYFDDPFTTREVRSPVILEIKVETFVPSWVLDLIRTFQLVQRCFSKYCFGLEHLLIPPESRAPVSWLVAGIA